MEKSWLFTDLMGGVPQGLCCVAAPTECKSLHHDVASSAESMLVLDKGGGEGGANGKRTKLIKQVAFRTKCILPQAMKAVQTQDHDTLEAVTV